MTKNTRNTHRIVVIMFLNILWKKYTAGDEKKTIHRENTQTN